MTDARREIQIEVISRAFDVDPAGELLPVAWVRVTVETTKGDVERDYKCWIKEGLIVFQRLEGGLVVEEYRATEFGCDCKDYFFKGSKRPCKHLQARSVLLGKAEKETA